MKYIDVEEEMKCNRYYKVPQHRYNFAQPDSNFYTNLAL